MKGIYYDQKRGRLMARSKRGQLAIYWSPQMEEELRRHFPTTLNSELSELFGVSIQTICRKARKMGLKKDSEWRKRLLAEASRLGRLSMKKNGTGCSFPKGYLPPTRFRKGGNGYGAKQCIDLETGTIYKSCAAAARALGVTCRSVCDCIRRFGRCKGHRIRSHPYTFAETEIEHLCQDSAGNNGYGQKSIPSGDVVNPQWRESHFPIARERIPNGVNDQNDTIR